MRNKYQDGNYGYGQAKQELYDLIITRFARERETFNHYYENPELLEDKLQRGEEKARLIARSVLDRVRKKLGFG
jgi:tryptophanyl-tRNA synthetase